jgi:folate-binding protein YgfZ
VADERQPSARLAEGTAFVDLSFWRKIEVAGPDASGWLNDLVSADVAPLREGEAKRSLLLSPTGRIRAEFTVARLFDAYLLLQDPMQPKSILELLAPYTLSSAVEMRDRTDELALLAVPGAPHPPTVRGARPSTPSCLGSGFDLVGDALAREAMIDRLGDGYAQAGNEAVEAWRVEAGVPRVGVDVLEDDLPQEAGLEDAVAFAKGCYLGQEAVAKVRNLGHPRRLLLPLEATAHVTAGDPILVGGREVGEVTSAVEHGSLWLALGRVHWDARRGPFRTGLGVEIRPRLAP